MKIFVLNRGSSSIKCHVYDFKSAPSHPIQPQWETLLEWKNGFDEPSLTIKNEQGKERFEAIKSKSAKDALKYALDSLGDVDVIGHRIVHGGKDFKKSVFISAAVKEKIRHLVKLAPLHNLPELEGIEVMEQLFKNKPQIAVFDTAFHHTLPKVAQIYPGPYSWYEEGILRYGFHGISYQYCSKRAAELSNCKKDALKMVICHLGSGASLCAVKDGKSIDTTMGFTPLEGLMMDTRTGTIDPGIILYLLEKKSAKEVSNMLYKESGLLGISGISSDMRDIIEKSLKKDARAELAFDMYVHRLISSIGSMIASLQGIDVLVFTAGIGENASLLRERVCDCFSFLGMRLDKTKNQLTMIEDRRLSASDSKVEVLLIRTQESFEIARECWEISRG